MKSEDEKNINLNFRKDQEINLLVKPVEEINLEKIPKKSWNNVSTQPLAWMLIKTSEIIKQNYACVRITSWRNPFQWNNSDLRDAFIKNLKRQLPEKASHFHMHDTKTARKNDEADGNLGGGGVARF